MRAVVRRQDALVLDDLPTPVPDHGQVLVKTLACGICGSDLHALHGLAHMAELGRRSGASIDLDAAKDVVFGHEFCAEVLDYGPGSERPFKPGTRVVSTPYVLGPQGFELVGYSNRFSGGFGEYMVLQEPLLLPVPNGLSDAYAALTEPFAVGVHAVARAGVKPGSVALIIGCGPVGLAVLAALKAEGIGPVVACDFSPERRRVAELMGADVVIDPAVTSPHAGWAALDVPATLAERGAWGLAGRTVKDAVIFECVGAPGMLQSIIEGAPPLSRIVAVGVCMQRDSFEPAIAINKELGVEFAFAYSQEEFSATLHRIAEGMIDVRHIMSEEIALDQIPSAFARLSSAPNLVKVIVKPWGGTLSDARSPDLVSV